LSVHVGANSPTVLGGERNSPLRVGTSWKIAAPAGSKVLLCSDQE
jgi:hypothetical protein